MCKYVYMHVLHLHVKPWKFRMFYGVSVRLSSSIVFSWQGLQGNLWGENIVFIPSVVCLRMGRTQDVLSFFWGTWYEAIIYGFQMKYFWCFFTCLYIFISGEYMINLALNLAGFLIFKVCFFQIAKSSLTIFSFHLEYLVHFKLV